ncbi:MAG: SDR family NAD(P)-dependent oxidoreductase [Clostridia bacterium]|nr:SDR family NAD(P)-dependent oxidoreductase [Clostridia bacterium]
MEHIKRKTVIVTGASGGMGKEVCKILAQDFNVIAFDIRPTNLNDDRITDLTVDVTDTNSIENAYQTVLKTQKSIHAIIHTAGIYDLDSLIEMDEQRFIKIFNVNLFGIYRINKAFIPLLEKGGKIIAVTSELAPLDPLPFTGVYAITKSALEKYLYSLRMELNLLGIKVVVVRPGAVKTTLLGDSTTALDKFVENTKYYKVNAEKFKKIVNSVENKNVQPQKIAKVIQKTLKKKNPKYVINVNRNKLLRLLNVLPHRLQVKIIGWILK